MLMSRVSECSFAITDTFRVAYIKGTNLQSAVAGKRGGIEEKVMCSSSVETSVYRKIASLAVDLSRTHGVVCYSTYTIIVTIGGLG